MRIARGKAHTVGRVFRIGEACASAIGEVALETVWPTRCAVCDTPGTLLCPTCAARLQAIDYWRCCPRCGAPWGRLECTECGAMPLADIGLTRYPFDGLTSTYLFDAVSARIVTLFKDGGERRLSQVMADRMVDVLDPCRYRARPVLTWIPDRPAAVRRRGFDHGEVLGRAVAARLGLPAAALLSPVSVRDQRSLSRPRRFANMAGAFIVADTVVDDVIICDDVFTTGSTLSSAARSLKDVGVRRVQCLTFARVYR